MSVKYTPGPWVAAGFWVEHPDENVPDICTCDPRDIDRSSLLRSHSEIKANARLIAAAPDMLEALQSLVRAVEQFTSAVALGWPELEQAKAVITQATGEQA